MTLQMNYKGYAFERIIYWVTLISIFLYALRQPLKKYRTIFFICLTSFLLVQCSQMFSTGKISTDIEFNLNEKFTIKSGTSLMTIPTISIYENEGLFEKEITQWHVHLGNGEKEFTSLNKIDSLNLLSKNDTVFKIRFQKCYALKRN